jgi:hypothetical protein
MHVLRARSVFLLGLPLSLAIACGGKDAGETGSSTGAESTESGTTGAGSETSGSESGETGATTATTAATDTGFVQIDMLGDAMCDIWNPDDCPAGEKCMPYAAAGSAWDSLKCVPIDDDPKVLGDECFAPLGGAGGEDDCGAGLFCYYVDSDTLMGTCISFCTGSATTPVCEPGTLCSIVNDGVLVLCRPTCDPVTQDCQPLNSACLQATGSEGFVCIRDASGDAGAYGDPCQYLNGCDPGLACMGSAGVPDCPMGESSCCTPFCDVNSPNNCPGAGQECVAWFESPVPDYEHVGVCVIPE